MSFTNYPNGVDTTIVRDGVKKVSTDSPYTVVVNTDSGKTFYIEDSAVTFTLPALATSAGEVYTFVNMSKDGSTALTINPAAADGISYVGDSTDDKDLINTAATAKKGDFVTLASFDDADHWQVTAASGVWAKEA